MNKKIIKTFIIFCLLIFQFFSAIAFGEGEYKIKNLIIDNSDKIVLIQAIGSYKTNQTTAYIPLPQNVNNSNSLNLNLINNLTVFTLSNPTRYVLDIPNSLLVDGSAKYDIKNSNKISSIDISQYSLNPSIVRIVFHPKQGINLSNFKTYGDGKNIIVSYSQNIIENSIQYKFYTNSGDMDKNSTIQNTYPKIIYNSNNIEKEIIPSLSTKYYLSKISQNSDGLILKGIGAMSLQKTIYDDANSKATLYIDNAKLSPKYQDKTFEIPSNQNYKADLKISQVTDKKIKLELFSNNLKDYRFVLSPDNQSLFISHRSYVLNTKFSLIPSKVLSYKFEKNQNGYYIFDINFDKSIPVDIFELNNNFYIDINNLVDFNETLFNQALKNSPLKIQALKISSDKTRFIIPMNNLNFSYGNLESNSKSIKLCFKEKTLLTSQNENQNDNSNASQTKNQYTNKNTVLKPTIITKPKKEENLSVVYIPKDEEKVTKVKKKKEDIILSSMKKVVLDPGHGGSDCGAIGAGLYEKTLNLEVAKLVQERLLKKNIYVYMTREKDTTLSLDDRTTYSNEISPDIYVSIHTNSTLNTESYGLETHYYKDDSYELARSIHSNFANEKNLKKWGTKNRGVIKSRFYVINHTEAPSVLIEIGFISNAVEREKLFTKTRQEEIADSIVKGILEYLKK